MMACHRGNICGHDQQLGAVCNRQSPCLWTASRVNAACAYWNLASIQFMLVAPGTTMQFVLSEAAKLQEIIGNFLAACAARCKIV
jgi:hypothetical protein